MSHFVRLILFTLVLVLPALPSLAATQDCGTPQRKSIERERQKQLEEAGRKLLEIIQDGDSKGLLNITSESGLRFSEGISHSRDKLAAGMKQKKGLYCIFFGTSCIQQDLEYGTNSGRYNFYSFRDVLNNFKSIRTHAPLLEVGDCPLLYFGKVKYSWDVDAFKNPNDKLTFFSNWLEFYFYYENDSWRLSIIPYGLRGYEPGVMLF